MTLKYHNFDIVFQEIPDETTLAFNLTGCPFRCEGCHSPHLRENGGEPLTREVLRAVCGRYGGITCICLMGGDAQSAEVERMAGFIRHELGYRSAWYSGADQLPEGIALSHFDYIKTGRYDETLGGLRSETTNQRLYRVENGELHDITSRFREKPVQSSE